ncbi:MAG TPA: tRNA (adenosine(37)-N6)-threonylcarbamoyltransferase complex ATPase subunit type 1 TsaE [Thermomicrobiales bacterium]|nr:tRNA (adenosine(37)-N6)-threonylcarbamoyltransferase complex ATPase subunit type 1 TsaE [Thermomicrobiales bacterium]HRA31097.1 tRNA (adenosine(37)-N6)-threonylcarbamoyltransferase complex ATPase subunit type 1 TsaE [Thermomicrobiales bacterium]
MTAARAPILDLIAHSPEQTRAIAGQLARHLEPGQVVLLSGSLGAGKTTFVQGLARALQAGDLVQSPTFTIVVQHEGILRDGRPVRIYHMDLYRMTGSGDLDSIGIDDYLNDPDGIVVIEWPDRAPGWLPAEYILVTMEMVADTKRAIRISPSASPSATRERQAIERTRREVGSGAG